MNSAATLSANARSATANDFFSEPEAFPLQLLPLELRRQIYRAYFRQAVVESHRCPHCSYDLDGEEDQTVHYHFAIDSAVDIRLLLTNKQVYQEASEQMYRIVEFVGTLYEPARPPVSDHSEAIEDMLAEPACGHSGKWLAEERQEWKDLITPGNCISALQFKHLAKFRCLRLSIMLTPEFPSCRFYNSIRNWLAKLYVACTAQLKTPNSLSHAVFVVFRDMTTKSDRRTPRNTRLERWKALSTYATALSYTFKPTRKLTFGHRVVAAASEQFEAGSSNQDGSCNFLCVRGEGDEEQMCHITQGIIEDDNSDAGNEEDGDEFAHHFGYYAGLGLLQPPHFHHHVNPVAILANIGNFLGIHVHTGPPPIGTGSVPPLVPAHPNPSLSGAAAQSLANDDADGQNGRESPI